MKQYYCNGKKDICPYGDDCNAICDDCEHYNGEGGKVVEVEAIGGENAE